MATMYDQKLWTESVSAVTATPSVTLGTRRWVNGNEYRYCYNGGGADADQRKIVCTMGYSYPNTFTVTTISGSNVCPVIGLIDNATCAAGSYCWVLTKGNTKGMISGVSTLAVGGAVEYARIVPCADGNINIATGGTGTTGPTIGYLVSAISDVTGTSVSVFVSTGF